MQKEEVLEQFRAFHRAAGPIRQEMVRAGVRQQFPAGAALFHGGEVVEQFALVGAGRIRVYKAGGTGREITLYHVAPGEVCLLTVASILGRRSYPATAVVEEAVEAVVFPGDLLRRWVEVSPAIRELVFGLFTSRLAHVMTLLEEIVFRRVDERLAEFLTARFQERGGSHPVLRVTHEEIAAELGTAREVVSRLLKELERRGAVRLSRGRIALGDPATLNE
jgi:CRP/FNR family transcriptional regulator